MKILTIILAILFAVDNIAIWLLIDAVQYLLEQYDVIDILLDMRREEEND